MGRAGGSGEGRRNPLPLPLCLRHRASGEVQGHGEAPRPQLRLYQGTAKERSGSTIFAAALAVPSAPSAVLHLSQEKASTAAVAGQAEDDREGKPDVFL